MSIKLEAALGFCARAGKMKYGDFAVERAVANHRARAILIDACASVNTKKKWMNACAANGLPLYELTDIGRAVGKKEKIVFAVTDDSFHVLIKNAVEQKRLQENTDT